MTVDTLQIIKKDGTVVDAIGIDESSTVIQLYIPTELFSNRELELFGVKGTDFTYFNKLETYEIDGATHYNKEQEVFLAETECYHMTGEYDNFVIKTISVEIPSIQKLIQEKGEK